MLRSDLTPKDFATLKYIGDMETGEDIALNKLIASVQEFLQACARDLHVARSLAGRAPKPNNGGRPENYVPWTIREFNEAKRMSEEGLSLARIAEQLGNGRTRSSVAGIFRREGIVANGESGAPFGNTNAKRKMS